MDEIQLSFERIKGEHAGLHRQVAALQDFLQSNLPEETSVVEWGSQLANRLVTLHEALYKHFREEEESGMFDELISRYPRANRAIEVLRTDHDRLLSDLRSLLTAALAPGRTDRSQVESLRHWARTLLNRYQRHEADENDLIQRLYCEDLGAAD